MKAIIFGANGQDGFYLKQLLENKNIEVISSSRTGNHIIGQIQDYSFVKTLVETNIPDYIFHFAANSATNHAALFDNQNAISTGSINILESVKLFCPDCKVFLSGSALQFKNEEIPINEHSEFVASSAYSLARIQSVYSARYYRTTFGLKVYTGYFFNHDSPLRSENHINQKIAKAALRIANGSNEFLELGNITVRKEFGFAGDVVKAVWTLINQDAIYESVIGTGQAYSIEDWLNICFNMINEPWEKFTKLKSGFIPEYKLLVSDPRVINSLGWYPEVNIEGLAEMMVQIKL